MENIFAPQAIKKLEDIYDEIDKLEKTEIEEFKYYNYEEKFRPLVLLALGLLVLEFLLRHTFKKFYIIMFQLRKRYMVLAFIDSIGNAVVIPLDTTLEKKNEA